MRQPLLNVYIKMSYKSVRWRKLVFHMCQVEICIKFHYMSNIEIYSMVFIYLEL